MPKKKNAGWDPEDRGARVPWNRRHDRLTREQKFNSSTVSQRLGKAVHNAGRSHQWGSTRRRQLDRNAKVRQAAAVQRGATRKEAREQHPTSRQLAPSNSIVPGCLIWLILAFLIVIACFLPAW